MNLDYNLVLEIEIKCIFKNGIIKQEIIWQIKYWRWWQKEKQKCPQGFLTKKMETKANSKKKRKGRKGTWFIKEKVDESIWTLGLGNRIYLR